MAFLTWLAYHRWNLRTACQSCDDECGPLYYYNNYDGRGWRPNSSLIRNQPGRNVGMTLGSLEEERTDSVELEAGEDAGIGEEVPD